MMLLDAAESLTETIIARASEIERARRLPKDLSDVIVRAGLYRMAVPREAGGMALDPRTIMRVIETIGQADASTGWCVMIGVTSGLSLAYLKSEVARTIHADPNTVLCGVFAPMGRARDDGDHCIIDGRWQWASNSLNADWMLGGCVVVGEDGKPRTLANGAPDTRLFAMPTASMTPIDSWHVAGLCGTGSGEIEVNGLQIRKDHSLSLLADRPQTADPLFAFPPFGFLALGVAAVMLGNARGAMMEFSTLAQAKRPQASTRMLAEKATVQAAFAEASAKLEAARAWFYSAIAGCWRSAEARQAMTIEQRAQLRLAATHATRTAADVVRILYDLAGGSAVFLTSPLQRRLRDAHVGTQHMMVSAQVNELTGRALLGQPIDANFL